MEAGARSQVSSVVSALLVALAVNFLTNTFHYIPMCSLAAIVQVVLHLDASLYRRPIAFFVGLAIHPSHGSVRPTGLMNDVAMLPA